MEIQVGDEYIVEQVSTFRILERERIVRCRDCKMFDEHYLKCFRPVLYFDHDYKPHWTDETTFTAVTDATPDGFCAWGERKAVE